MKKKQATSVTQLLAFASAILAIVSVVMIFLPRIASVNTDTTYTGIDIAFGKTLTNVELGGLMKAGTKIDFSFLNLLSYILIAFGLLVMILQLFGIGKSKLFAFLAAIALIAGGVMFFLALQFSTITVSATAIGVGSTGTKTFAEYNTDSVTVYKLGYASIVGGVTAIVAGVCALGKAALGK